MFKKIIWLLAASVFVILAGFFVAQAAPNFVVSTSFPGNGIWDSSGNVGIGTTGPTRKLQVEGDFGVSINGNSAGFNVSTYGYATQRSAWVTQLSGTGDHANVPLSISADVASTRTANYFNVNNIGSVAGSIFTIYKDGNVGIGTTTPQGKLDINGTNAHFYFANDSYATPYYKTSGGNTLFYLTYGGSDDAIMSLNKNNVSTVQIWTNGNSFFNGGNVGIGTTAPTDKLEVRTTADGQGLTLGNTNGYGPVVRLYQSGADGHINLYTGTNPTTLRTHITSYGDTYFNAAGTGNVGIGTTAPNDTFSIGNSGAAPAGSSATGHNYTSTYLSTDNYALTNYGLVKTLIAGGSGSSVGYWTMNGTNIYNSNAGNVGIGTTGPLRNLSLYVASSPTFQIINSSTGSTASDGLMLQQSGLVSYVGNQESGDLQLFVDNGASNRVIQLQSGSGNVGVGTTGPGYKLDVNGDGRYTSKLWLDAAEGLGVYGIRGRNTNEQIEMYNRVSIGSPSGWQAFPQAPAYGLSTYGGANFATNQGSVGIGTTAPNDTFSIGNSGAAPAGSSATGHNYTSTYLSTDNYALTNYGIVKTLIAGGSGSSVGYWTMNGTNIYNSNAGNVGVGTTNPLSRLDVEGGYISTHDGGGYAPAFMQGANGISYFGNTGTSRIAFGNATNYERMTILDNGSVGIGVTAPAAKLDVTSGDMKTSSILAGYDYNGTTFTGGGNFRKVFIQYNGAGNNPAHYIKLASIQFTVNSYVGAAVRGTIYSGASYRGGMPTEFTIDCTEGPGSAANCQLFKYGNLANMFYFKYVADANGQYLDRIDIYYLSGWYATAYGTLEIYDGTTNVSVWSAGLDSGTSVSGTDLANNANWNFIGGNVGIGTTAPNDTFSIGNSGAAPAGSAATGHNYTSTYLSTDNYALTNYGIVKTLIAGGSGSSVGYWTMNGTNINNSNSGNVGIGTTNPNQPLHVQSGTVNVGAVIHNSNTTSGASVPLFLASNSGGSLTNVSMENAGTGNLLFRTGATSESGYGAAQMTIQSGGNVGIGTTGPATKLQVVGGSIQMDNNQGLYFFTAGSGVAATNNGITGSDSVDTLTFRTAGQDRMIISTGSVGIGTNSPGAKFETYATSSGLTWNGMLRNDYNANATGYGVGLKLKISSDGTPNEVYKWAGIAAVAGTAYSNRTDLALYAAPTSAADAAEKMRITGDGNVGIGTTAPNDTFSIGAAPAGSAATGHNYTSTYLSTDNYALVNYGLLKSVISDPTTGYLPLAGGTMNSGAAIYMSGVLSGVTTLTVNKINATTIDPLYSLNGVNYATFVSSISGGVKEEYVGKVTINSRAANNEYEKVIDFSREPEGSDLWVWRQVVDYNYENVEVLFSPYGQFANVYYLIKDNKLIFRSDKPVTLAYRLVGRRFDWRQWPTKAVDQTEQGIKVK